jgi:hypothetical protein
VKIRYTKQGRHRVDFVDTWWRTNRPAAPTLFKEELKHMLQLLKTSPEIGERYKIAGGRQVYKVLLPQTQQYLYYVVDEPAGEIWIYSVWGTARRRGPMRFNP